MRPEKQEKGEREREEVEVKEQPKKPYSTPQLTKFGDAEELTEQPNYDGGGCGCG